MAQDLPRTYFFLIFFEKFETFFFEDLCSWRAVQKSFGGYLSSSNFFFWQHRVSIVIDVRIPEVLNSMLDRKLDGGSLSDSPEAGEDSSKSR